MFPEKRCPVCGFESEDVHFFDHNQSTAMVSVDCPNCRSFRILTTLDPGEFEGDVPEIQAWIKQQPGRLEIRSDWRIRLAEAARLQPNY